MVIDNRPLPQTADNDLLFSISCLLKHRSVMNATGIASYFSMDVRAVRAGLFHLARSGQVEVLRPVGSQADAGDDDSLTFNSDDEYFRWKNETDRMYLWQHALWRRPSLPRHRIYDLQQSIA